MIDRIFCGVLFVLFMLEGAVLIHQELKIQRYEQLEKLHSIEIDELYKKLRIAAQDYNFLEKIVLEGDVQK